MGTDNQPLDWNSSIENDGNEFTIFEEDTECDCEVISFEASQSNLGAPMAKLRIRCVANDASTIVEDNLALQKNCEWKLCEFFIAIGLRRHRERFSMQGAWEKVEGAQFRAKLSKEPWKTNPDKFSNKIKKYLQPVQSAAAEEVSFGDDNENMPF